MIFPLDDSIIDEKNRTQELILEEAKGDLREYRAIVHRDVEKLQEQYGIKFQFSSGQR